MTPETLPASDYAAWRFWLDVLQLLGTALIGTYVWIVSRTRYNTKQLREHENAVDARLDEAEKHGVKMDGQIAALERRVDQIGRVHKRIDILAEEVHQTRGEFEGVKRSVDRVHEYLLHKDR